MKIYQNKPNINLISVFLNVNFTGKIISQEHIEFVKSIKLN